MTNEPYLWDKSEPQDAFVAKLERFLTPRRDKVKQAGQPRGPRILRLVGSVAMAAAATVMVWVCFESGDSATTPGTDQVAPPVAVETTIPAGASTEADAALEETADVEKKAANDDLEQALGEPALDTASPATMR